YEDVFICESRGLEVAPALFLIVLGPLDRTAEGSGSARNDALDQVRRNAKSRGALARVQNPQSPAGSAPDVEQSSAGLKPLGCDIDSIGYSVKGAVYGFGDIPVFVIYQPDDTPALQPINIFGPGICLLSYRFRLVRHFFIQTAKSTIYTPLPC